MSYDKFVAPRQVYSGNAAPRAPRTAGHDSVLRAIREQQRTIHLTLMSGEAMEGTLVASDKFTMTVKVDGVRHVVFKHGIEQFFADETPATETKD
jgi:RNA chaperone Hfq